MLLNHYPAHYRKAGSSNMVRLLELLKDNSPVLNSDLSDLMPWAAL